MSIHQKIQFPVQDMFKLMSLQGGGQSEVAVEGGGGGGGFVSQSIHEPVNKPRTVAPCPVPKQQGLKAWNTRLLNLMYRYRCKDSDKHKDIRVIEINVADLHETLSQEFKLKIAQMYYNCFKEDLQNIVLNDRDLTKFIGIFIKKDGNPALLSNYDLVGYCFLQFKDPYPTAFIHSLCIDTSEHGRGFCSKLMCYIIWKYGGIDRIRPAYNLELDVRTEPTNPNIAAFKCYHKFGFVFAKPEECFLGTDGKNCRMHRLIDTDANHITTVVYDDRSDYVNIDGVTPLRPIIIPKDATIPYKDYFEWDLL